MRRNGRLPVATLRRCQCVPAPLHIASHLPHGPCSFAFSASPCTLTFAPRTSYPGLTQPVPVPSSFYSPFPSFLPVCSHRHVPAPITKAKKARFLEEQKVRRKMANVRAHSREGSGEGMPEPERKKRIVAERK